MTAFQLVPSRKDALRNGTLASMTKLVTPISVSSKSLLRRHPLPGMHTQAGTPMDASPSARTGSD